MAVAEYVNSWGVNESGGGVLAVDVPVVVTGGSDHLLVVFCRTAGNGSDLTVTDDSGSNSWSYATAYANGSAAGTRIAYCLNPAAGSYTVTVTATGGAGYTSAIVAEYSGILSSPLDVATNPNSGSNNAPTTSAFSTVADNELIIQYATTSGTSKVLSVGTIGGVTANLRKIVNDAGIQDLIVSSTQSNITGVMHLNGVLTWDCRAVSFKSGSAGSTYNEPVELSAAAGLTHGNYLVMSASTALQAYGGLGPDSAGSIYNPVAALAAIAALSPSSDAVLLAAATLQAAAALVASGGMSFDDSVALTSASVFAAAAALTVNADATLQAGAAISLSADALLAAAMSLLAGAGIASQGQALIDGTVSLPASAAMTAQGQLLLYAVLSLAAAAGADWVGEVVSAGIFYETVSLVSSAGLSAQTLATLQAITNLAASGGFATSSTALMEAALVLLTIANFSTAGEIPGGAEELYDTLVTILRRRRGR